MAKWIAFFSQTGSEIVEVSKQLKRWPDIVITNNRPAGKRTINKELLDNCSYIVVLPNKPQLPDYYFNIESRLKSTEECIITLHGWLRIVPEEVIKRWPQIYNGHPGLITKYPELKGKDPQMKAWNLGLQTSGCVIHKVTAGVDEGPVYRSQEIPIRNLTLDQLFDNLHKLSISMWVSFLRRHWF